MSRGVHVETIGHGPPLVLLHGWGMHGGIWGPWLHRLAHAHRLHVVDLPGHGRSADVPLRSLDDMVEQVAAVLPAEPVAMLGWSLGALVALELARTRAAEISRLVLVAATPRFTMAPDWPAGVEASVLARFGDELGAAYRLTLQRFLTLQLRGTDAGRHVLAAMRAELFARGTPTREALAAGLEILRITDLRASLAAIAPPTLVIAGERDTLVPIDASRFVAARLPHGELLALSNAAHVPFLSHPHEVADAVLRFADGP